MQRIGRITGPYTVPSKQAFAVIEFPGTFQYKVTPDDIIFVNKLNGVDINDVLALGRVMLIGTPTETVIGRPYIQGASVVAAVEEHFKDAKIHVFKKKPRKRYSKHYGHRSHMTTLRILDIKPGFELAGLQPTPAVIHIGKSSSKLVKGKVAALIAGSSARTSSVSSSTSNTATTTTTTTTMKRSGGSSSSSNSSSTSSSRARTGAKPSSSGSAAGAVPVVGPRRQQPEGWPLWEDSCVEVQRRAQQRRQQQQQLKKQQRQERQQQQQQQQQAGNGSSGPEQPPGI
eukprot:jgi/Chrzof1/11612/Cz06g02080.t1